MSWTERPESPVHPEVVGGARRMKSSEPVFPSHPLRSGTESALAAITTNFRMHG